MNIMIINGSPKKIGGASAFFAKILQCMLFPHKVTTKSPGISKDYREVFDNLQDIDVVVITVPLYVDSIPAHFIHFLKQLEQYCKDNKCKFMLYVISNAGFVGGHHNQAHLEQYECWCERTGITWGGGLGIGGGVMLHVLYKIMFIWTGIQIVLAIINNIFAGIPLTESVLNTLLPGLINCVILMLFFYCGMLLFEFILAWAIRNKWRIKNKYTRVMLPSFIFIVVANIFMALTGLFHGKLVFSLFKKVKYTTEY
jgi:multimeric flavodoxin WrbA